MKNILITGIAGFIGFHTALHLKKLGHNVFGTDNFNNLIYDPSIKRSREAILKSNGIDVQEYPLQNMTRYTYSDRDVDTIIHLAAHANPRIGAEHPYEFIDNNINGTQRVVDFAQARGVQQVLYASSSSILTGNQPPWPEDVSFFHHKSPYGWSKFVNECQFINSSIPSTAGLRFFTVYGPYGRPDMAIYTFTRDVTEGNIIQLYGHGKYSRDFTYIEDAVQGITCILDKAPRGHELYNVGRGWPTNIEDFLELIEDQVGKRAHYLYAEGPATEAITTHADTSKLQKLGYAPRHTARDGIHKFVAWYKDYHK